MRVATWVMILLFLPVLAFSSQDATRRVVLDDASLGQPALEKTISTTAQTGFSFHLAGVELTDKVAPVSTGSTALSVPTYQQVTAITDTPEKFGETDQLGMPDLPVYSQLVGIPDQAGVRAEIVSSSYQIIENVDAYPFQRGAPDINPTADMPFSRDDAFYQKDEFYPSNVIQMGEPVIFRDLRMISATINPVQYNPVRKELKVYTNINFSLNYEGVDTRNQKIRHNNNISETFLPMYRAAVPNADEMLASYQPIRGGYLILYPRTIPDSLVQLLARWKHLKGYSVVTVPDSAIAHNASPSATQIFAYIQNAYNNWAVPPEFVCIMGSIFVTNKVIDYPHDGLDSDHPYACVDGSDYFADIMVTRMSMPLTNAVMRTTIWKGLIYDKTPFMGDSLYWTRALSCAGNVGAVTPRLSVLWVREMLLRRGFTRVDTAFGWGSGDPNIAPITASFNNGVSLTSYRGWGFPTNWGSPSFSTSNLDALQFNNKISPCCAPTCGTGNFGVSDCFGEHWCTMGSLTSGLKGGPGYFGACGEDTETRYDNPFMVGYYAAILMEGIYNFANACFFGKMELYDTFPFNRSPSAPWPSVAHYTYSFNPLGEPEFEVRTGIPRNMTVTYPQILPVGSSMLAVHVVGYDNQPLDSAYVCLVKGRRAAEEVFVGGRTDENGDITLNFSTTVPDTMFVTVTSHNYIPHTGFTLVQSQSAAVNVSQIVVDDDNQGSSHGNSDGNANPGETVEFAVTLKNFGVDSTAANVSATLTSSFPEIVVTVPTQSFGSIDTGATATSSGKFAVALNSDISDGERYVLSLNITSNQGNWTAALPVDISNMLFARRNLTYPGNANNRLDPGETSQLVVSLQNLGHLDGTALTGVLTTSDTSLDIINGTANFGDIAIQAVGSDSAAPFTIAVGRDVYRGRSANVDLKLTSSNGSVAHMPFSIPIGAVTTSDPVGPDRYGYYLYDNTDVAYQGCPTYNWVDLSTIGTRVTFTGGTDDNSEVINSLPFDIKYYGQTFNYLLVSINGFVAFDTSTNDRVHHWANFDNNQIPEPSAPDGIICPFWDDLEYTGTSNGVYKYADSTAHRFILEWKGVTHTEGNLSSETFEMIFYDPAYYPTPTGDCEIVFQYNVVHNDDNDTYNNVKPGLYSTVGIQSVDNMDGLEYTFDNYYAPAAARLMAGRAIKATTVTGMVPPPNLAVNPGSFAVSAPTGQMIADTLDISNTGVGPLSFTIGEFTDDNRILINDGGQTDTPPVFFNHGGPDSSGNSWVDSDDPGGPAPAWVDISIIGTPAGIVGDNGFVGPIDMGISFPFYDSTYSAVYISANGLLTFGAGSSANSNTTIPNAAAPNNFLTPLWDDLSPQLGGSVMYYRDVTNGRFIVSYINVPFYYSTTGTGNVSFEAILYPNGRVLYEYGSIDGGTHGLNSLTIGMEKVGGTDGLRVIYNAAYLHSNMAVLLYPQLGWLRSSIHGGTVLAASNTQAVITFDATNLPIGAYSGHLSLETNDPDSGLVLLPITFNVSEAGPVCHYVVGDVNGDSAFNGLDIVYAVRYFHYGQPTPVYSCECPAGSGHTWFVAGNVNGNCVFNGMDVSYGVNYLKGGPVLAPCPDCLPGGGLLAPPVPRTTPTPDIRPALIPTSNSKPRLGSAQ